MVRLLLTAILGILAGIAVIGFVFNPPTRQLECFTVSAPLLAVVWSLAFTFVLPRLVICETRGQATILAVGTLALALLGAWWLAHAETADRNLASKNLLLAERTVQLAERTGADGVMLAQARQCIELAGEELGRIKPGWGVFWEIFGADPFTASRAESDRAIELAHQAMLTGRKPPRS